MKSKIKLQVIEKQKFVVNWDELPEKVEYVAVDKSKRVDAYFDFPEQKDGYWYVRPEKRIMIYGYDQYWEIVNWKDTLRSRKDTPTVIDLEVRKEIEHTVDWDDLPDWADYVAIDSDGEVYYYEAKPHHDAIGYNEWNEFSGKNKFFTNINKTVHNWKDALVKRPTPKEVERRIEWVHYTFNCPSCLSHAGEPKYAVGDKFVVKSIVSKIYTVEEIIETEGEYYYKLDRTPYLRPESVLESVLEEKFLKVLT